MGEPTCVRAGTDRAVHAAVSLEGFIGCVRLGTVWSVPCALLDHFQERTKRRRSRKRSAGTRIRGGPWEPRASSSGWNKRRCAGRRRNEEDACPNGRLAVNDWCSIDSERSSPSRGLGGAHGAPGARGWPILTGVRGVVIRVHGRAGRERRF